MAFADRVLNKASISLCDAGDRFADLSLTSHDLHLMIACEIGGALPSSANRCILVLLDRSYYTPAAFSVGV